MNGPGSAGFLLAQPPGSPGGNRGDLGFRVFGHQQEAELLEPERAPANQGAMYLIGGRNPGKPVPAVPHSKARQIG
ncbi:hypothetical protein [Mycetocola lacteus]|uniref:hypothetical protein n=1 Tax=Mycetocola lacteus TaxID=76637 RepID=UPI00160012C7|nr:hypothetical protein [Mycetocola lacteus]